MAFTAERIPGQPIVVCTIYPEIDIESDPAQSYEQVHEMLADEVGTLYRIINFLEIHVEFSHVVMGLASDPGMHDPRMRTIMVGTHDLVRLAAAASSQEQYGAKSVELCTSVEEAVATAQAELAAI